MSEEKPILDQIFDSVHKWLYGEPEQKQHEGHSSADESGETTEVIGEPTEETSEVEESTEEESTDSGNDLPRDRGM